MSSVHPSVLLRRALFADAALTAPAAIVHLAAADALASLLALPAGLLAGSGAVMVAWVLVVGAMARAARLPAGGVAVVIVANIAWAIACLALALGDANALGAAFLIGEAVAVLVFGELQFVGLRRSEAAPDHRSEASPSAA